MRLIRAEDCRRMPWKNGGGETFEIAVSPAGAALDGFDWRLSRAKVGGDGPFSLFPGVDRTLCVLEGGGLLLDVDGAAATLTMDSEPHRFPADVPTSARLVCGPVSDLNMMTRRARCTHTARRLGGAGPIALGGEAQTLAFCASGHCAIEGGSQAMAQFDALHLAPGESGLLLRPGEASVVIVFEIRWI